MRRNLEETAERTRYIRWPVAIDEKAKARVRELRMEGGVSSTSKCWSWMIGSNRGERRHARARLKPIGRPRFCATLALAGFFAVAIGHFGRECV
jgi:hypothetical protein